MLLPLHIDLICQVSNHTEWFYNNFAEIFLCCHVKIPQSHKNMYWLISTLIDSFVFCVRITHIPIGLRCCSYKKVSLLQHIDREHTALLHREAARREAGRGGTESLRTDERWDILAELLPRQGTLSWPARAAPAASFSLLHSPHHTTLFCLILLTPSTFTARSSYM